MKTTTIGEIGEIFDGPHATPTRQQTGKYFLNISSLKSGRLDLDASDHVSDEDFKQWTRRVTPREGDLLFSYETRLGEAALMPAGIDACLGRRMALIRPDQSVIDPRFLLYYWMSPSFQSEISIRAVHGATVSRILLADLGQWPIRLPELAAQAAIGEVLGALDDKIAANRRVIAASEELRAHLWKRACASGQSEVPLSSLARFVNGRAFTKDASGTGRVVIRIAELNSGIGASTVRNDIVVADDHLARPGDLLLAWSGSLTAARWYRDEAIVNQHIFKVIPGENFEMWAVASAVESKLADFKEIARDKATTMGHIRRSDLDQPVGWPVLSPEEIGVGRSLWSRALSAEMENEVLIRARDELLPLLMDGRITVEDAEKVAENVL